jgi:hypothetical protein
MARTKQTTREVLVVRKRSKVLTTNVTDAKDKATKKLPVVRKKVVNKKRVTVTKSETKVGKTQSKKD